MTQSDLPRGTFTKQKDQVSHINNILDCPLCDQKLETAHPKLKAWFKEVVKPKFLDAHVSWAFRDKESQNQLCAEGKSKLCFPKSKHNYMQDDKPCALAIDLFQIASNGMSVWSWKYFKQISELITDEMNWGGNWAKFPDSPHYELKNA